MRIAAILISGISMIGASPILCETPGKVALERIRIPSRLFRPPAAPKAVPVKAFLLDRYAVTNGDYARFVAANPEWRRSAVKPVFADQGYLRHWPSDDRPGEKDLRSPVTNVSWFAARAYCRWRSGRLPTQLEWERAAAEPVAIAGASSPGKSIEALVLSWYEKESTLPLPAVGSTYQNRLGVFDLHGLVWEWIEDFNSLPVTGDSRGGLDRSLFCAGGAGAGITASDYAAYMRYAFRSSLQASFSVQNLGFRCAYDEGGSK